MAPSLDPDRDIIVLRVAIVGCGRVGIGCARLLGEAGHQVTGLRRNVNALPNWLQHQRIDVLDKDSVRVLESLAPDLVIYQVTAAGFNEDAYRAAYVNGVANVVDVIGSLDARLLFVSSTGVYHQSNGSWVDEDSPVAPVTFNGQLMLEGERLGATLAGSNAVRFSGIYGPDRLRLIEQVRASNWSIDETGWTNRIHTADCAQALFHIATLMLSSDITDNVPGVWLASDSAPARRCDVMAYIAQLTGVSVPHLSDTDSVSNARTSGKSSRRAGSKRCSNRKLLNSGFQFKYPNFRQGYTEIIQSLDL